MMKIKRVPGYMDRLRSYDVILDGKVIGKVGNGKEIEFDIPKGRHKLYMKIDWCRSNVIEFEYSDGTVEFECGSNLRGIKMLFAAFYSFLDCDKYLWLKKVG